MKKTRNGIRMLVAGTVIVSAIFLYSCNKNIQDKSAVAQDNSIDNSSLSASPIAVWNFDSSWTESKQGLVANNHGAKFSSKSNAYSGKAAFNSMDSGFVSYGSAGTALPNLTTGFSVDFWVFAKPKAGGAQCLWCLPQTGQFWPTHHVLLDGYNPSQGDSALIKVMFKANRDIPYNEEWTTVSGIPNFYNRWSHIQYSYNGATSQFLLIVNNKRVFKDTLFTNDPTMGGEPLGNIVANPNPKGVVIGAFQNTWKPDVFGDPQPWMLGFKGRIDALKIYNKVIQF